MRVLGRWMRLITLPNQPSIAKAFREFDEAGRMSVPFIAACAPLDPVRTA